MLKCIDCGYEQMSGKFCGDCGTKFEETNVIHNRRSHSRLNTTAPTKPNVHIEKLIVQTKAYRSYLLRQLKKPALAYENDADGFPHGLTSIILFGILIASSLFISMNQSAQSFPSFISGALIFSLLAMGIGLLTLLLITTYLSPQQSIKTIISLYGAHLPPLLIGATASFLLMLIKSYTYGHLLLSLIFLLAIWLVPIYLLSALILKNPTTTDPFYILILYLIAYSILFGLFSILIANSAIGGYFSELIYWFD